MTRIDEIERPSDAEVEDLMPMLDAQGRDVVRRLLAHTKRLETCQISCPTKATHHYCERHFKAMSK